MPRILCCLDTPSGTVSRPNGAMVGDSAAVACREVRNFGQIHFVFLTGAADQTSLWSTQVFMSSPSTLPISQGPEAGLSLKDMNGGINGSITNHEDGRRHEKPTESEIDDLAKIVSIVLLKSLGHDCLSVLPWV